MCRAADGRRNDREDMPFVPPEPNWLFSNRSQWYPQNQVTDYATATIRFTVPADHTAVASGVHAPGSPTAAAAAAPGQPHARDVYLRRDAAAALSRRDRQQVLRGSMRATVALDIVPRHSRATTGARPPRAGRLPAIGARNTIALAVEANRRQQERGRDIVDTAAEILRLYAATVGDVPYDSMTIAMVEHERPGGHSARAISPSSTTRCR